MISENALKGCDSMDTVYLGAAFLAVLMTLPALYLAVYAVFRFWGVLAVNAWSWHAGSLTVGRAPVLSAVGLFSFFQPPLRMESALWRRWRDFRKAGSAEPGVSEVVVEVVPMA